MLDECSRKLSDLMTVVMLLIGWQEERLAGVKSPTPTIHGHLAYPGITPEKLFC